MITIQNIWEVYARAYNHFYAKSLYELHQDISSKINSGSVLDLGCGTGKILRHTTPSRYLGIESSKEMLKYAKEEFRKRQNTSFENISIAQIPTQGTFDNILMINVLYSLKDEKTCKEILERISKKIKPKSRFIFTNLNQHFSPIQLEKLIEEDCKAQISSKEDEIMYLQFQECNQFLAKQNPDYRPLTFNKEKLRELMENTNLEISDELSLFETHFEKMCDLVTCIKKH